MEAHEHAAFVPTLRARAVHAPVSSRGRQVPLRGTCIPEEAGRVKDGFEEWRRGRSGATLGGRGGVIVIGSGPATRDLKECLCRLGCHRKVESARGVRGE